MSHPIIGHDYSEQVRGESDKNYATRRKMATKMIKMTKKDFVAEHTKLPKILVKGSKTARISEAKKQLKELKSKVK